MSGESAGSRYLGSRQSSSKRALAFKDCMQHMSSEQTEGLKTERVLREKVSTLMPLHNSNSCKHSERGERGQQCGEL